MNKKYIVTLTGEERNNLESIIKKGKTQAYRIKHANILLASDANGQNWDDKRIAKAFRCHMNTVQNVRQRFVEQGFDAALNRKKQKEPPRKPILDGEKEAKLIQIACSEPPEGRAKWTLQMLADKLVELEIAESVSDKTVGRVLKKNELRLHMRKCWVIPPEKNADFVACVEDVLDVYKRAYDPDFPVICMDEQLTQLIGEIKTPVQAKPGQPLKYDYQYKRNGTATNFMFTEPLGGWRNINVLEKKTAIDQANEIKKLLTEDYPDAKKVILICDNLNTHKPGSLYKAFPPGEARKLLNRLEIHYTPKHGSWLNIAEIELSVFTGQCLSRRIPDIDTLKAEVKNWWRHRNTKQKSVNWQFKTDDARIKLKRLYPQIQMG